MQLSKTEDEKKEYFEAGRGTKGRDGRDGWMDAKDSFTYVHVSVASIS